MSTIRPIDTSQFSVAISRDLRMSAIENQPGPPPRIDGMMIGFAEMSRNAPHGGELHPDGDELIYIVSGKVRVIAESARDEPCDLGAGQACIIPRPGLFSYLVRLIETTQFSSWFFQGGDYNSFVLLRNTTYTTINFVIRWFDPAGTEVATSGTQSVAPNGGVGLNSKTFVPAANINGTVAITHDGPPGGLVGQMTSLSATTGLGFDSTMFTRDSWGGR